MNIIDDTYNGDKYPIVERHYNAYYFPDNFDPDEISSRTDKIIEEINDKKVKE